MSHYFPKPFESYNRNVTVELDWSNYIKGYLKRSKGVGTSDLAAESDLPSLKLK